MFCKTAVYFIVHE